MIFRSHSDGNKTTNLNTVDRKFSKSLPKFVSKILRINKKNFVEIPEMFEVDGSNVFSPYKDMPRDLPRIFLQVKVKIFILDKIRCGENKKATCYCP